MMRMLLFICAVTVLDYFAADRMLVDGLGLRRNFAKESDGNRSICTDNDALGYSHDFHNCFVDRKYQDGGRDLENIVDRILDHSSDCIRNSTRDCRPNYNGFMVIMDKVITQMKDYCLIYLEYITYGRNKVKDLECVETSLSNETYGRCFEDVFEDGKDASEEKFQKKVETAISCTNKSHKLCSRTAKTSLNKLVRTILGVRQPDREDIEEEKPPKPWMWYDYIIQPFISMWSAIRSFFGF